MNEWKEYKLGDAVTFQRGFDITKKEQADGSFPVVSSSGIQSYHQEWKIDGPGVIIGRKGTLGTVFYLTEKYWPHDTTLWVKDFHGNIPLFIYYFLKVMNFENYDVGSSNPTLNRNHIHLLQVFLPSIDEQKHIAEILSSLDDKIALLQRQNKILEQLVETLFRQWFVEEASEDWEFGKVIDLFILQRGFDLPYQNRVEGKYPVISASGTTGFHNEYKVKGPGVTTGRSGLLGEVFYIDTDFWALNTSLFIVEYKLATPLYAYFFLKSLDLASLNGGSAVPTLNRNDVHDLETQLPPKELIQNFENIAFTFFQKIKSNNAQIKTLTQLRDTLLPKLMIGEVRVKN